MFRLIPWVIIAMALTSGSFAQARNNGPKMVCEIYPQAGQCRGKIPSCTLCHTAPPQWNDFGMALVSELEGPFDSHLESALKRVENDDSDGDGISNLEEILLGTNPGNPSSLHIVPAEPLGQNNPHYSVGEWSPPFAFRRVASALCGRSASFEEMRDLKETSDPYQMVHDKVDACLGSKYWLGEALPRMADKRIRPRRSFKGFFADYDWDYNLFIYVLTDGRDARELLTADYHVTQEEDDTLTKIEGIIPPPSEGSDLYGSPPVVGGQPLAPEHRAGMITTQWFLVTHTMGAVIPRGTAAQAYRSYLGLDLSHYDGVYPVENEPRDLDNKGTAATECQQCHSTLDPLAYAFAYYWGFGGDLSGDYMFQRPAYLMPELAEAWYGNLPKAHVLGSRVQTLPEWGQHAANSDQFKRNLVMMFFRHALGRKPFPQENDEFEMLWKSLPEDDYAADKLLHRLVDTQAFGAP